MLKQKTEENGLKNELTEIDQKQPVPDQLQILPERNEEELQT